MPACLSYYVHMYLCINVVFVQITNHALSVILRMMNTCASFIWTVSKLFRIFFVYYGLSVSCLCEMDCLWMNFASFPCFFVIVHKEAMHAYHSYR